MSELNRADGERNVPMRAREEGNKMSRKRAKRDTYTYELKNRGKVVYRGITNDVERRVREHEREGKRFTTYCYDIYPSSRKTAREREKCQVETYKKGHRGRKPKHNKVL